MEDTNIIRNIIRKELNKINLMEWESGYYPPGAENDPRAPWNDKSEPELESEIEYAIDYDTQKFQVTVDNGNFYEVDFIDFIELYWKKNPGTFEKHEALYGGDDTTADVKIVQSLKDEGYNFTQELIELGGEHLSTN